MPSIEANRNAWSDAADEWWAGGAEWSTDWGNPTTQWFTTLLPRIHMFLPASTIVEIAPGFGRWTQFLIPYCENYVGVDLAPRCIEACRERFAGVRKTQFAVNDGRSLPLVADGTADFVFSFDSLVHAEIDVLAAYLAELARALAPHGVAFIHHSNAGTCERRLRRNRRLVTRAEKLPPALRRALAAVGLLDGDQWRGYSVTAEGVDRAAAAVGLQCVSQELIPWRVRRVLLDAISIVVRPGSRWAGPKQVVENWSFMAAAGSAACVARAYPSGESARS